MTKWATQGFFGALIMALVGIVGSPYWAPIMYDMAQYYKYEHTAPEQGQVPDGFSCGRTGDQNHKYCRGYDGGARCRQGPAASGFFCVHKGLACAFPATRGCPANTKRKYRGGCYRCVKTKDSNRSTWARGTGCD